MSSHGSPAPGRRIPPRTGLPELPPAVPWPHLVQQRQLDLLMGDERALLGLPGGRLLGGRGLLRFTAGRGPRGLGQLCGRVPFPLVLFDPIFFFRLSCQQQTLSPSRHPGTALSRGPPEGGRALSQAAWLWDGAGRFLRFPVPPREAAHTLFPRGACPPLQPQCPGYEDPLYLSPSWSGLGWGTANLLRTRGWPGLRTCRPSPRCAPSYYSTWRWTPRRRCSRSGTWTHTSTSAPTRPQRRDGWGPEATGGGRGCPHPRSPAPGLENKYEHTGDSREYSGRSRGAPG